MMLPLLCNLQLFGCPIHGGMYTLCPTANTSERPHTLVVVEIGHEEAAVGELRGLLRVLRASVYAPGLPTQSTFLSGTSCACRQAVYAVHHRMRQAELVYNHKTWHDRSEITFHTCSSLRLSGMTSTGTDAYLRMEYLATWTLTERMHFNGGRP